MKIISDLHIHSRFAMACSKQITLQNLEKYARIKGLQLLGTGDFQHPVWSKDIEKELEQDENGILWSKTKFPFIFQTEISLMYSQGGRGRRLHLMIFSPNKEVSDQITAALLKKGRIDYDGRPIFGFTAIELVDMMNSISKDIEIVPAHVWTPWFGLLGEKSGFDSVEECFQEKSKYIHALETGMSSDPAMNWRLSKLDKYNLVSFSDMHSFWPWRIGREATTFDINKLTYKNIIKAIRTGEDLHSTVETDPGYGRYHFDGHRKCGISFSPQQTHKHKGICPVCKKKITIGVEYRVEELADRPEHFLPKDHKDYFKLIPLTEILSKLYKKGLATKTIWQEYNKLVTEKRSEFDILLKLPLEELKKIMNEKLANIILKNRRGEIKIIPGYDGVYGVPVFNKADEPEPIKLERNVQKGLGEF